MCTPYRNISKDAERIAAIRRRMVWLKNRLYWMLSEIESINLILVKIQADEPQRESHEMQFIKDHVR
jgi:hypothetical protein